jgi:hypothetical protein
MTTYQLFFEPYPPDSNSSSALGTSAGLATTDMLTVPLGSIERVEKLDSVKPGAANSSWVALEIFCKDGRVMRYQEDKVKQRTKH